MRLPAFVCLSVCLLARLPKNTWMDLDEILRVDRCHTDELITFEPDPDHSPDPRTGCTRFLNFSRISQQVMDIFR